MITVYKTMLDDTEKNILVKEREVDSEYRYLNTPERIVRLMNREFLLNKLAEEHVYMLAMNSAASVLGIFEVSHGSGNSAYLAPREVFIRALLCGATQIILVHNHPGKSARPTEEDMNVTKKITEAGKLLNIPLTDHIIIGAEYFSFHEKGLL